MRPHDSIQLFNRAHIRYFRRIAIPPGGPLPGLPKHEPVLHHHRSNYLHRVIPGPALAMVPDRLCRCADRFPQRSPPPCALGIEELARVIANVRAELNMLRSEIDLTLT